MSDIVLASASPRRRDLFKMMGIDCSVDPSDIEEILSSDLNPSENVCKLAVQKALDVARRYENSIIIASDTIVVKDDVILGKPESASEAARMLASLSGNHHYVFSGVSVLDLDKEGVVTQKVTFFGKTKVTFSTLDEPEIKKYISTGSPMDKAGAYGIQDDYGSLFIKKIEGDYYNVVGFPVNKFYQILKQDYPAVFNKVFNL